MNQSRQYSTPFFDEHQSSYRFVAKYNMDLKSILPNAHNGFVPRARYGWFTDKSAKIDLD